MIASGVRNAWDSFKTLLAVVALLWAILFAGYFFPIHEYGIWPRSIHGLYGILFAPFIHAGIDHLIANSISLLLLGSIFLTIERKLSIYIVLFIIVIGGLGTWVIGRGGYAHIGASGVIYGILGYLLAMGVFNRSIRTVIISLLVFFLYGGAIWGIFPAAGFVSWESHLCGFLAGIATARIYAKNGR